MNMPKLTILYASLLILLGIIGYIASGAASVTALIPAFFGLVVLITGIIAKNEKYRKHAMHVAAILALIGIIATFSGLIKVLGVIGGGELERPMAAWSQAIMSILSIAFFSFTLKSFIDARRARTA